MRGTTIFVLASLVLPNFVTAVPVTGTASLNVIPDVKRHAETTEDLVKRSLEAILLPHDAEALVERNRGIRPGRKSRSTGELVDRARGVARPGSNSRSADGETAELVGRGRVVKPTKKRDTESTEDLVERGRVVRPGTKRDAEATEDLVERGRVVRPGTKRDAEATEDLVERGRGMRPGQTRDLESFEYLAEEITV